MRRTKDELAHIANKLGADAIRMVHHLALLLGSREVHCILIQEMHSEAGIDNIKALTLWTPRTRRIEGIKQIVEWYMSAAKLAFIFQPQIAWPNRP